MLSRRLLLSQTFWFFAGCAFLGATPDSRLARLMIGVIAYGEGELSLEKYNQFVDYLARQTRTLINLEPVYNERKAITQIQRLVWDLVFAPPGLAAIAVSQARYLPLFPLQGISNLQSVLVVLKESPIQQIADLNDKAVALGQPGSATGYYVPLYTLYGLTLSEVKLAPTPETVLEWIAKGEVDAGALSQDELDRYRSKFNAVEFRIINISRRIPAGSVLISPKIERNQQELIQKAMNDVSPNLAAEAAYIPNAKAPSYNVLISFIEKVKPIEARIDQKPAPLYEENL